MAKKKIEEVENDYEKNKRTIYECTRIRQRPSESDCVFAVLCVCGFPAALAFRIAYPRSKASVSSSSVLASRRLREPEVQRIIGRIVQNYWLGLVSLKEECNLGSSRGFAWLKKRKSYISPDLY